MTYILTFWNYRRQRIDTIRLDGDIELNNVLSYFKRNGWSNIDGVWHSPKEKY